MAKRLKDPRVKLEKGLDLNGFPVTLVVGSNADHVFVHSTVLCRNSKFFQSALKTDGTGSETNIITSISLPDDCTETVKAYVHWLYCKTLPCETDGDDKLGDYEEMARLYVFGEKVVDSQFQDRVMDTFVSRCRDQGKDGRTFPAEEVVNIIYQGTPKDSPARKMLVHLYHDHGTTDWTAEPLAHEFLEDLTKALLGREHTPSVEEMLGKELNEGVPSSYYKFTRTKKAEENQNAAKENSTVGK